MTNRNTKSSFRKRGGQGCVLTKTKQVVNVHEPQSPVVFTLLRLVNFDVSNKSVFFNNTSVTILFVFVCFSLLQQYPALAKSSPLSSEVTTPRWAFSWRLPAA